MQLSKRKQKEIIQHLNKTYDLTQNEPVKSENLDASY